MARYMFLQQYLDSLSGAEANPRATAFYATLDTIQDVSPTVVRSIIQELRDQRSNLKLIASENYSSLAVQFAGGNLLTDKYAEGYPGHRFYAGCDNVDDIESEAADLACKLFGAEHAFVQPHSGSDANLVAYLAVLAAKVQHPLFEKFGETNPTKLSHENWETIREATHGQRFVAQDYYSGGHLTHGYRFNYSSLLFDVTTYGVNRDSYLIDLDELRSTLHEVKPLIFLAGYSAYSRKLNFAKMREMADEVGAVFLVDMAHFAGLVAGGVEGFTGDYNPVPHAHIVISTTHKTLRGPRGGIILCKKEFSEFIDKACPMILGGPLPHAMAAKAVAFREDLQPEFKTYTANIVKNAQALAEACVREGMEVLTGGTDNHMLLIDAAKSFGLTGRQAESALRECGITLNRNAIPFDDNGPWYTSGLRIGTPAVTTLGMDPDDMRSIAAHIKHVLSNTRPKKIQKGEKAGQLTRAKYSLDKKIVTATREKVQTLLDKHLLYPEIDLDLLTPNN